METKRHKNFREKTMNSTDITKLSGRELDEFIHDNIMKESGFALFYTTDIAASYLLLNKTIRDNDFSGWAVRRCFVGYMLRLFKQDINSVVVTDKTFQMAICRAALEAYGL